MSRLLQPGLGDYLDRLSILQLKIADGRERGRDIRHFETERAAIWAAVGTTAPRELITVVERLAATNRAIWEATDYLLAARTVWPAVAEPDVYLIADHAMRVLQLNEDRAELVRILNGTSAPEKLR